MDLIVHEASAPATVQDLGRPGARSSGVPTGGAMDAPALRVANLLVGNPESAAGLECAVAGPVVSFSATARVAVCGAEVRGVPGWRPIVLRKRERLDLRRFVAGYRAYLAVAGGLDVPAVLGSRSTDVRTGFGGYLGRALRAGDRVPVGASSPADGRPPGAWQVAHSIRPRFSDDVTLRVILQPDAPADLLTGRAFVVDPASDRMGVRLRPDEGPSRADRSTHHARDGDLPSRAVVPGTVQLPPDGRPIILAADAPTIGGYAVAGVVITVDQALVAQLRPGHRVRFEAVDLAEARRQLRRRERALAMLRVAMHPDARIR